MSDRIVGRLTKPTSGSAAIGLGSCGGLLKAIFVPTPDASGKSTTEPVAIAVKVVFNFGLSTSQVQTHAAEQEFKTIMSLPEHPNIVRLLFATVTKPPMWMVEQWPQAT